MIRLRGGRSYADGARGTRPSGLPSIVCGRGRVCPFICAASACQKNGGPKGRPRQVFPHMSITRQKMGSLYHDLKIMIEAAPLF